MNFWKTGKKLLLSIFFVPFIVSVTAHAESNIPSVKSVPEISSQAISAAQYFNGLNDELKSSIKKQSELLDLKSSYSP